jgi:hypothetical protein
MANNGGNSPASIEVRITVKRGSHGLAHFTYDPSTFMCKHNDTLKWRCEQGPFAIHFGERALLGSIVIDGATPCGGAARETALHTVGAKGPALQPGMYKYSVAVQVTQNVAGDNDIPLGLYIDACPSGGYAC